jgi:hypothetical protein
MVPIAITSKQEFDHDKFRDHLLKICKKHKKQQRALAFAFIVYDLEDYTIHQILKNKDYWSALDKISGRHLSVFYINSRDTYYKERQRQIHAEEVRKRQKRMGKNYIGFLTAIPLKPTPLDNAMRFVEKEFQFDETLKHPFVLFFQTDGEEILDYFIVTLKQEKLEDAFLELRSHIKNSVKALEKVSPENYKNHQEIFNLIRKGIEEGKFYDFVNRKIVPKIGIGTIISLIGIIAHYY